MVNKIFLRSLIVVSLFISVFALASIISGCVTCKDGYKLCKATCVLAENQCPCTTDADCASEPGTPYCNTVSSLCVECLNDGQCSTGNICDLNKCTPGCRTDAQCPPSAPHCFDNPGKCVKCASDSDCSPPTPRCIMNWVNNQPVFYCAQCKVSADCASGYYCNPNEYDCEENRGTCCVYSTDGTSFTCSQLSPPAVSCSQEDLWTFYIGPCNEVPICNSGVSCPSEKPKCSATASSGSTTYLCCAPGKCGHKPSGLPLCLS